MSQTIEAVLKDRMVRTDVTITHGMPKSGATFGTPPKLNLYLYQVAENPAFRNDEEPRRALPGQYGKPPLAVELGFLVTTYGVVPTSTAGTTPAETLIDLDGQAILADAMRVLHELPIVTAATPSLRTPGNTLLDPGLKYEFESVRITPRSMNLDELTKLWTSIKEEFQRSVAYEVSVIRIALPQVQQANPPVLTRGIRVRGSVELAPVLEGFDPDSAGPNQDIVILGRGLEDPSLQVFASDAVGTGFPVAATSLPVTRTGGTVKFRFPAAWMAGPKSVELRAAVIAGHPIASMPRAINLRPRINTLSQQTGAFNGTTTVTLAGVALGRSAAGPVADPLLPTVLFGAYPIPAANLNLGGLPNSIIATLPVPDPADPRRPQAGQALPVRVRVNGVESAASRRNPLTGVLEMDPALLFTVT